MDNELGGLKPFCSVRWSSLRWDHDNLDDLDDPDILIFKSMDEDDDDNDDDEDDV